MRTLLFALLLAALAGCGGGERWWRVFHQASPNPMVHSHAFVLAPFLFDGINIEGRSEGEFMTGPPELVASYMEGKTRMVSTFAERMAGGRYGAQPMQGDTAPPGTFVIRPHVTYVRFRQRNAGNAFGSQSSAALVHVQIFTSEGALVDDVRITATVDAGRVGDLSGEMNAMGASLARLLDQYLHTRTGD